MFKAMIVDDEYNIREGMRTIIDWEEQGFIIVGQASDGMEALELYEQLKPSLVITDIKMPRMDGIGLTKELKRINPEIEIIILSGYNDFSYAKEAMKSGVGNYLLKPVSTVELCNELSKIKESITGRLSRERKIRDDSENLKNYFICKMVRGELLKSEAVKMAQEYGILINGANCCVVIGEIDHNEDVITNLDENDLELKIYAIENIINEILAKNKYDLFFVNSRSQFGMLLMRDNEPIKAEDIKSSVFEVSKCIKDYVKVKTVIAAGEIVNSIFDIHTSYISALTSLESLLSRDSNDCEKTGINMKKILTYIQQHYTEDISLKKLSELFFVNPVYLGQVVKKEAGSYFNDYINRLRVENAKRLLEKDQLSINEIAEKVGYKYLDHFYKSFKNVTGYNPGEYRALIEKKAT